MNKLVQSTSSNDVYIMDVSNFSPAVQRHPIHLNKTMCDVQEETRDKINQFIALGCRVYEMWECQSSGQTFCKQSSHYHTTQSL